MNQRTDMMAESRSRSSLLHRAMILTAAVALLGIAGTGASIADAQPAGTPRVALPRGVPPVSFEANQGQLDPRVKFFLRADDHLLYLTPTEAVLELVKRKPLPRNPKLRARALMQHADAREREERAVLVMRFVGASPEVAVDGTGATIGHVNYYLGNDPTRWVTGVPVYAQVHYRGLYPGIDLLYHGARRRLEYDVVVAPGADVRAIALEIQGADRIELDRGGDLVIHTRYGPIRQKGPVVYQMVDGAQRFLTGRYAMRGPRTIGFEADGVYAGVPLVIDPVLTLGPGGVGQGQAQATDAAGNSYTAGFTSTPSCTATGNVTPCFPANVGQTTLGGASAPPCGAAPLPACPTNAFVAKTDTAGNLIWATYLGGGGAGHTVFGAGDFAQGIALDSANNVYVTGSTDSVNFPTTPNAYQAAFGGGFDAFFAKLNANGVVQYSTYLGGRGDEQGVGIAVDASGKAYVGGSTSSTDFPTTAGVYQPVYGGAGPNAVFVAKVDASRAGRTSLVYSTFIGGKSGPVFGDFGQAMAVDASGNAYVAGFSDSVDYPVTPNAAQKTYGGGPGDAIVSKLDPTGATLLYSTYLGGGGDDFASGITVDASGNASIAGSTSNTILTFRDGHAVPSMMAAASSVLSDVVLAQATTAAVGFPITPMTAAQPTFGGGVYDSFLTTVNGTASTLLYSTFLGGGGDDFANAIAGNSLGQVYVAGDTNSTNFPAVNPVQTVPGGAYIAKFDPAQSGASSLVYSTTVGTPGSQALGIAVDPTGAAYVTGPISIVTVDPITGQTILTSPIAVKIPDTKNVRIEIHPESINLKSKGKITVEIFSAADVNAPVDIDPTSLTFGHTGNERSLAFCGKPDRDDDTSGTNARARLVCHFYTQLAKFQPGDTFARLRGTLHNGNFIVGKDSIRIVPPDRGDDVSKR